MPKDSEPKLKWRPVLEWGVCRDGYSFTKRSVSDPAFPQHFQWEAQGGYLTFIEPRSRNSDRYTPLRFEGLDRPVYEDFVNIGRDLNKLEIFVNKYGLLYDKGFGPGQNNFSLPPIVAEHYINDVQRVRNFLELVMHGSPHGGDDLFINTRETLVRIHIHGYELLLEPRTIKDFIYWQIISLSMLGKIVTRCEICGEYMSPVRKTRKQFCSSTCRSRHNRGRAALLAD